MIVLKNISKEFDGVKILDNVNLIVKKGKITTLLGGSGVGKTTLLRSVAKKLSSGESPMRTVVIDTRGELSFSNDSEDLCLDVLSGYPRRDGVDIATRCLNAEVIICDEIGDYEEAMALLAENTDLPQEVRDFIINYFKTIEQ